MTTETAIAITSVGYSRLSNLGNYENEKVTANARVEEGQDPDAVLASVKEWVSQRVTDIEEERINARRHEEMQYRVQINERRVKELTEQAQKVRAFLERHGVEVKDWPDDFPF